MPLWFTGNWQEKLELWGQLILSVQSIREIDSSNSAVSMDLYSERLYVVGTVGPSCEIGQVELDLIPSLIQSHWHGANEWLDSGCALVVTGSESTSDGLIIQNLYFESEVFFQILDNHDQERKLDGKCLLWVQRSIDVVGGNISTHDLKN